MNHMQQPHRKRIKHHDELFAGENVPSAKHSCQSSCPSLVGLVIGIAIRKGDPLLALLPLPEGLAMVGSDVCMAVNFVRACSDFRRHAAGHDQSERIVVLALGRRRRRGRLRASSSGKKRAFQQIDR